MLILDQATTGHTLRVDPWRIYVNLRQPDPERWENDRRWTVIEAGFTYHPDHGWMYWCPEDDKRRQVLQALHDAREPFVFRFGETRNIIIVSGVEFFEPGRKEREEREQKLADYEKRLEAMISGVMNMVEDMHRQPSEWWIS